MWIIYNIAARTLIWLAVIAIPVQSLPASSCGCSSGGTCCQGEQKPSSCCSAKKNHGKTSVTHSCCGESQRDQDSPCNCEVNCQCGKSEQPKPATPPVENNAPEKAASDSVSMIPIHHPQTPQPHRDVSTAIDGLVALNSCVSLCRFTL